MLPLPASAHTCLSGEEPRLNPSPFPVPSAGEQQNEELREFCATLHYVSFLEFARFDLGNLLHRDHFFSDRTIWFTNQLGNHMKIFDLREEIRDCSEIFVCIDLL